MLSARTAVASAASPASPWKAVGASKGGSCDGCRTYRESVRRRAATVRVHAAEPRRVQAVAIGTAAETEEAAADGAVDPYAEDEEVPVMPSAYSVAR